MIIPPDPGWVYQTLYSHFGPQGWWPAEDSLEVIAGAVLVQNTSWRNAARAVRQLRTQVGFEPGDILAVEEHELARMICAAGTFRVKARRLRAVFHFLQENGSVDGLSVWPTPSLRRALLTVHGIGPETAEAILLYAFQRPVFVVDAYARRLFARLGIDAADAPYNDFSSWMQSRLLPDVALMNELHALVVKQCKDVCRRQPRCESCSVSAGCAFWEDRRQRLPEGIAGSDSR